MHRVAVAQHRCPLAHQLLPEPDRAGDHPTRQFRPHEGGQGGRIGTRVDHLQPVRPGAALPFAPLEPHHGDPVGPVPVLPVAPRLRHAVRPILARRHTPRYALSSAMLDE